MHEKRRRLRDLQASLWGYAGSLMTPNKKSNGDICGLDAAHGPPIRSGKKNSDRCKPVERLAVRSGPGNRLSIEGKKEATGRGCWRSPRRDRSKNPWRFIADPHCAGTQHHLRELIAPRLF